MNCAKSAQRKTFSFAEFVRREAQNLVEAKAERAPNHTDIKIRCAVCEGEGAIMATTKYSKLQTETEFFKTRKGANIETRSLFMCPCCNGTGVDADCLEVEMSAMEKIKQAEVA